MNLVVRKWKVKVNEKNCRCYCVRKRVKNGALDKLKSLTERLLLVTFIKDNFELIEWVMGNDDISRKRLLDQDGA